MTLDELLLLHEEVIKDKSDHLKMLLVAQGVDVSQFDDGSTGGGEELPPEVLAAERAWQEKKRIALAEGAGAKSEMEALGIGYNKK